MPARQWRSGSWPRRPHEKFVALPGIGWGISCARSEGDRIEVKAAEVEEDRHFKPLAVSEPSSEDFDFLNLRIHALRARVGNPMREERLDVGPVTPQHARQVLDRLQPTAHRPRVPAFEV